MKRAVRWGTRLVLLLLPGMLTACAGPEAGVGVSDVTESRGSVLIRESDGLWYADVFGPDGEHLLATAGYRSKKNAESAVDAVLRHGSLRDRYDVLDSIDGGIVVLYAANGAVIAERPTRIVSARGAMVIAETIEVVQSLAARPGVEMVAPPELPPETPAPTCDASLRMVDRSTFSDHFDVAGGGLGTVASPEGVVEAQLHGADESVFSLAPRVRVDADDRVRACLFADVGADFECLRGDRVDGGCCAEGRYFSVQIDLDQSYGDDSQPFLLRVEGIAETSSCIDFLVVISAAE